MRAKRAVVYATRSTKTWVPVTVLFASFLDIFALLPTVAPYARSLGASTVAVGVVVGAYSLANLPANLIGGILVDRYGRRRVIIASLAAAGAAVAAYSLATTLALLILIRLLHGVAGGILMPAVFALASQNATAGSHGRTFGKLGAVIGFAAVVAPASAGIIRQTAGYDAVFLTVAAALLLAAVFATLAVFDPPRDPAVTVATVDQRAVFRALLAIQPLRRALAATVLLTLAAGVLAAYLPDAADAAGARASMVGALFTVYALCAGVVMLSRLSARIDVRGSDRPAAVGLTVIAGAFAVFTFAPNVAVLTVGAAVFGTGYGLVFPAVSAATSLATDGSVRGRAFGLFNVAFSVGLAFGPVTVGWLANRLATISPFLVAAGLLTVGTGVLLVAARRPQP